MSLNVSALSFGICTFLSAALTWRAFIFWKKQKENQVSYAFFKALFCACFYMGVRAIASFLFVNSPDILAFVYLLSHVFLGIAIAYIAKFAIVGFFELSAANSAFIAVLILAAFDVILNIFFPNQPHLNPALKFIDWGTHKYVGIYHTLLLFLVFLGVLILFAYKAYQNWQNHIVRTRCLLISFAVLIMFLTGIPRNVFRAPLYLLISDIGLVVALGIFLWAITSTSEKGGEGAEESPS